MAADATATQLHVHGVDGYVAAFAQNDAETSQRITDQMRSGRIFTQPYLFLTAGQSLSVFPTAKVVRVDLVMRGFPDWPFHLGFRDVAELTREEYRRCISSRRRVRISAEGVTSVYAEIEMTNEDRIYVEMQLYACSQPTTRVDFYTLMQQLLSSPSLHARRLGGGAMVINPSHILRVRFSPAPLAAPNGWVADPVAEQAVLH